MDVNLLPAFDVADWNTSTQSSIAAGVATLNGVGGPAANSVDTMVTYEWQLGVTYTVRVKVITFSDFGGGSLRAIVDGTQHVFTAGQLPAANGVLEFTFVGAGNTTDFDFRSFSMSAQLEDPFAGVVVAAEESPPANYTDGDVLLHHTNDNGDIIRSGGVIEMTSDFRTMVYLCLFGGNRDDDGAPGNNLTWWGNLSEDNPSRTYRSEFQHLIDVLPLTSANLVLLEDAALRDLEVFITDKIASTVEASATIPTVNTVKLDVRIEAFGEEHLFSFTENWRASV